MATKRWLRGIALGLAMACLPFAIGAQQSPVWHFINGVPFITTLGVSQSVQAGDGSASAPSYSFASETNKGFYTTGANIFSTAVNGVRSHNFRQTSFDILSDSAELRLGAAQDVILSRGAANRLDLATGDSFNLVGGGGSFQMAGSIFVSSTAPTVTSAGTSPTVPSSNGTIAFTINVGTGGTATTIVAAMPTMATGWNCNPQNLTANAANRANQHVVQQSSTTTSVTVQNQTISTGAALAFTASDVVSFLCAGR